MQTQDIIQAARDGKRVLQGELRQARREVQRLSTEIARLDRIIATGKRWGRMNGVAHTDPRKAAGPGVIAAVEKTIRTQKTAPQSVITSMVGKHSGSVSWALKALTEDGVVRPTGERVNGSKVYEYVPPARRVRITPGK